tara:strand:- start:1390 stop:1656 length:267 start_codon:yes stop_codon:yes gene_type:complete
MDKPFYAFLKIQLKFPYHISSQTCTEFAHLWDCQIIRLSSVKGNVVLAMRVEKFKVIFGVEPSITEYQVPRNTESFLESLEVTEIRAL